MGRKKSRSKAITGPDYRELPDERLAPELALLLESGKSRQSLEIAKEIRRRSLLGPHRELVERAYRLRAMDLARQNLYRESIVMVENALDCGVGSLSLLDIAARSAIAAGEAAMAKETIQRARLDQETSAMLLADLAVLASPSGSPSIRGAAPLELEEPLSSEVARVQRAFDLYEEGFDEEARAQVAGIGRRSPLSRWRLVLRGLIARAAGDLAEAREAWKRAGSVGPCGSIALHLSQSLAGSSLATPSPPNSPGALRGSKHALLSEIKKRLIDGGRAVRKVLSAVEKAVQSWPGGLIPAERERLARALMGRARFEPGHLQELSRLLHHPIETSLGLRAAALRDERNDPEHAHRLWIEHLEGSWPVSGVRPEETTLAEALIWERAGDLARQAAVESSSSKCSCPVCQRKRRRPCDVVQPGAEICYRKCIALDPDSLDARKKLVSLLLERKKKKEASRALEEILERWPHDSASALRLGEVFLEHKSFLKAHRYFERARALEPLNRAVLERLAECRAASACRRAEKGRFELARKDFQEALAFLGASSKGEHAGAWAAMEHAAGEAAQAEVVFQQALSAGAWEPDLAMEMLNHLLRFGAPPEASAQIRQRFFRLLAELPVDPPTVDRAAALYSRLRAEESLEDRKACEEILSGYFQRAADLPFEERKRLELCHFFRSTGDLDLLEHYARAGRKGLSSYQFVILEVQARLESGQRLPGELVKALRKARQSAREDPTALARIERLLDLVEPRASRIPFLQALIDLFANADEEDEENFF